MHDLFSLHPRQHKHETRTSYDLAADAARTKVDSLRGKAYRSDTLFAQLNMGIPQEQLYTAPLVDKSKTVADIERDTELGFGFDGVFEQAADLASSVGYLLPTVEDDMRDLNKEMRKMGDLYRQAIDYRYEALEMALFVSLCLQVFHRKAIKLEDANLGEALHLFESEPFQQITDRLYDVQRFNNYLKAAAQDHLSGLTGLNSQIEAKLDRYIGGAISLYQLVRLSEDVEAYQARARLLRAFHYHARERVAERKMRFDQAVTDVQTARLAYRGITGHSLNALHHAAYAQSETICNDLAILKREGAGRKTLSDAGKSAMKLWSFVERGKIGVSREHVVRDLELQQIRAQAEADYLDTLLTIREIRRRSGASDSSVDSSRTASTAVSCASSSRTARSATSSIAKSSVHVGSRTESRALPPLPCDCCPVGYKRVQLEGMGRARVVDGRRR